MGKKNNEKIAKKKYQKPTNKQKEIKNTKTEDTKSDSLWRKPIVLDDEADDDPLAMLYQGREVKIKSQIFRFQPLLEQRVMMK